MARGKKRRKKKSKGFHPLQMGGGGGKRRRGPTAKAKAAYYKNVRKAYNSLKSVAEKHGFA